MAQQLGNAENIEVPPGDVDWLYAGQASSPSSKENSFDTITLIKTNANVVAAGDVQSHPITNYHSALPHEADDAFSTGNPVAHTDHKDGSDHNEEVFSDTESILEEFVPSKLHSKLVSPSSKLHNELVRT